MSKMLQPTIQNVPKGGKENTPYTVEAQKFFTARDKAGAVMLFVLPKRRSGTLDHGPLCVSVPTEEEQQRRQTGLGLSSPRGVSPKQYRQLAMDVHRFINIEPFIMDVGCPLADVVRRYWSGDALFDEFRQQREDDHARFLDSVPSQMADIFNLPLDKFAAIYQAVDGWTRGGDLALSNTLIKGFKERARVLEPGEFPRWDWITDEKRKAHQAKINRENLQNIAYGGMTFRQ